MVTSKIYDHIIRFIWIKFLSNYIRDYSSHYRIATYIIDPIKISSLDTYLLNNKLTLRPLSFVHVDKTKCEVEAASKFAKCALLFHRRPGAFSLFFPRHLRHCSIHVIRSADPLSRDLASFIFTHSRRLILSFLAFRSYSKQTQQTNARNCETAAIKNSVLVNYRGHICQIIIR